MRLVVGGEPLVEPLILNRTLFVGALVDPHARWCGKGCQQWPSLPDFAFFDVPLINIGYDIAK